jgi:nucleolar protein 12
VIHETENNQNNENNTTPDTSTSSVSSSTSQTSVFQFKIEEQSTVNKAVLDIFSSPPPKKTSSNNLKGNLEDRDQKQEKFPALGTKRKFGVGDRVDDSHQNQKSEKNKKIRKDENDKAKQQEEEEEEEENEEKNLFHKKNKNNLKIKIINTKNGKNDDEEQEKEDSPEKLERTVFVGNVPVEFEKRALKKIFAQCGPIESLRYRSIAFQNKIHTKKVSAILNELHPERDTCNAYIVFKDKESAERALDKNNMVVETSKGPLHLRVDSVIQPTIDNSRSIFVGNLPFTIHEETVRKHFETCGGIEAVRIVRDKETNLGKGFGYVLFETKAGMLSALMMHKSQLEGRKVRVFKAMDKPKQPNKMKRNKVPRSRNEVARQKVFEGRQAQRGAKPHIQNKNKKARGRK